MFKKLNFKSRRLFLFFTLFVLLISLSSCRTAGKPTGKLPTDEVYAKAGEDQVTVGELWDELRWSANSILTEKINEAVMKDYYHKVEVIMDKTYEELTADDKDQFGDGFNEETYQELKVSYEDRLQDYVIEDIYNFNYNSVNSYEDVADVKKYDAKKLIQKYSEEMYLSYDVEEIDGKTLIELCEEAANDASKQSNYTTIAKQFKTLYYQSLAKELLAYDKLEDDIQTAYDERDKEDEDDLGYFTKTDYTSKFKSKFANQGDINMILIHFSTKEEFNSTLRSFGIKQYNDNWYYIPSENGLPDEAGEGGTSFADYCTYYDDLSSSDIKNLDGNLAAQELNIYDVALIYIQMYNYLYGGYRDIIYNDQYISQFNSVDLRKITAQIREDSQKIIQNEGTEALKTHFEEIVTKLNEQKDDDGIDTFYTRKEIDKIDGSFNKYLYETLALPFDESDLCYSTDVQSYNSTSWIAFKLTEGEDEYSSIYNKDTVDDDLFDSIEADEALKLAIEKELKQDKITSNEITTALEERTKEVEVKIYDESLEIAYAAANADYSKTYGSAPNDNVMATIKYDGKTYNLNIMEDLEDENALISGVYNLLEQKNGITTSIDILSKKIVKKTKAYEKTAEDIDDYKAQLEYVLAAFSNDYYSSSGYPSTIGKYNFMMLYFHTANIDDIVDNIYRVNGASASLLTDYNSDALLNLLQSYSEKLYENHFSIGGKRLIVYLDADDNSEKDKLENWKDDRYIYTDLDGQEHSVSRGELAQELIEEIYKEVSTSSDSHDTALTNLVTEINNSARALFEENPIAPENKWSNYRRAGLMVELEEISATNDTTSLDFKLKQRMFDIFHSSYYSIENNTTPTEFLEDITNPDYVSSLTNSEKILETEDGYNLLLITSADYQTSAEFSKEDDPLGLYQDISVYYNEKWETIGEIYNEGKILTKEQIRLYILEYVTTSTSNLVPSALSAAYSAFLTPIITRFTGSETQREIVVYFIEQKNNVSSIDFVNQNDKYQKIIEINHRSADDYIFNYYEEDTTNTLKTYEQWWTDLEENVSQMLLKEGED